MTKTLFHAVFCTVGVMHSVVLAADFLDVNHCPEMPYQLNFSRSACHTPITVLPGTRSRQCQY